jgi:REP element-mobilizing transposase RayT
MNAVLPKKIKDTILQCKADGKEYAAVYLLPYFPELFYGHATVLLFDLKDNLQWYFDPEDGIMSAISYTTAFSQTSYIDGFDVVPANLVSTSMEAFSIQKQFETVIGGLNGTCGLLVVLVLVCCMRFDYWNTQKMSHMILQAANTRLLKHELMTKFIDWYMEVDEFEYEPEFIRAMMNIPPKSEDSICGVFLKSNNKLCKRHPTSAGDLHQFCWQHRQKLQE